MHLSCDGKKHICLINLHLQDLSEHINGGELPVFFPTGETNEQELVITMLAGEKSEAFSKSIILETYCACFPGLVVSRIGEGEAGE